MKRLKTVLLFIITVLIGLGLALGLARLLEGCTETHMKTFQMANPGCEIWSMNAGKILVRCPFKSAVVVGGVNGLSKNH